MDLFLNRRSNIQTIYTNYDFTGLPFFITGEAGSQNQGSAKSWGGEAEVNVLFTDWLSGYANYSYISIHGDHQGISPQNMANGGLLFDFGEGFKMNLNCNYVESSLLEQGAVGLAPSGSTDSYFIVNSSLSYEPPESNFSFLFTGFNMLHDSHVELPSGENIGTLFTVGIGYRF